MSGAVPYAVLRRGGHGTCSKAFSKPMSCAGTRIAISGREPAVQEADGPVLLGLTGSVNRRWSKATGLLKMASGRSHLAEPERSETGEVGQPLQDPLGLR